MAWPREPRFISCEGFPRSYLPALMKAVDHELVRWGKTKLYLDAGSGEFEWAGATWELHEMRETVWKIELLNGNPSKEDLTVAVLKGKIKT